MATRIRKIEPGPGPFDLGTDSERRAIVGFSVDGEKDPSATWLQELAAILVENSIGVVNENIFLSSSVSLPRGDGPYLTIVNTGGTPNEHIQNDVKGYEMPSADVRVHARTYLAAHDLAYRARDVLFVRNRNVTPIVI